MAEFVLPTWVIPRQESQEWLNDGVVAFRAAFAPGLVQRQEYGGSRLKLVRAHDVRLEEAAVLESVLGQLNGAYHNLFTKVHKTFRGSFPTAELLTNNTFANGTTGWSGQNMNLTVSGRILRGTVASQSTTPGILRTGIVLTPFFPYVMRSYINPLGRGDASTYGVFVTDSSVTVSGYGQRNYALAQTVPVSSPVTVYAGVLNNLRQGDYIEVPWCSYSRCALVDNTSNLLLRSNELDNAIWTKGSTTITANVAVSPLGASTADEIVESAASANHRVRQDFTVPSATNDFTFVAILKAGTRAWAYLFLAHATGSPSVWVNLATGALGTVSGGTDWAATRAHIAPLGNSWYKVSLTSRKTSNDTTVTAIIGMATGDAVQSYLGDGSSSIFSAGANVSISSAPTQHAASAASQIIGVAPADRKSLFVKGLPLSTNGLALPGDMVEINRELRMVTHPLNSDGTGCGLLHFWPPSFNPVSDNEPVIFCDPMGKFMVSNIKIPENRFGTQFQSSYDLEHIYE